MKPPTLVNAHTTGTLGDSVETVKMGFDEDSIEHLLMLLTDLYSDKVLAVIREYSTNARDEHILHGVKRPIEVTLPNPMSPFFKVRDYASGMSAETVAKVYSKYGASTKRGSNDFNGMLGIGGKSALTYTTQFTVSSVHEGQKIIVIVSRVGQKAQMQIISQAATNEPSGVEVTVPVKADDVRQFQGRAADLFRFWDEGLVLVNGKAPERIDLSMITDSIGTTKELDQDYIVMGGIPYPVSNKLFDGRGWNSFNLVAFVGIGDVAITPSREALMHDTPATDDTIALIKMEVEQHLADKVQKDINEAATKAEAWERRAKWKAELGGAMPANVMYQAAAFPDMALVQKHAIWNSSSYRHSFHSGYSQTSVSQAFQSLIITGFDADSITPRNREKIRAHKDKVGLHTSSHLVLPKGEAVNQTIALWVPAKHFVSWDDIKAIKLPPKTPAATGPKKKPTIDVYAADGSVSKGTIDPLKTLLYVSPAERLTYYGSVQALYKAFPDVQLVELGQNRWDKFKRENPKAQHVRTFLTAQLSAARDTLSKDDLACKGFNRYERDKYKGLDVASILDPEIRKACEIAEGKHTSAALTKYNLIETAASAFKVRATDFPTFNPKVGGYVLFRQVYNPTEKKHMVMYLNAVFAANNPKKEN